MIKYQFIQGGITAPSGFKANGIHCGIRKNKLKKDLALIVAENRCTSAAVYTQNLVKGAPLAVTKKNLSDGYAQAVICNSGNANTCNADGVEIAEKMCALVEKQTGISIMKTDIGLDTGDILRVDTLDILPNETYGQLSARLSLLGAESIVCALNSIKNGDVSLKKQSTDGVNVVKKIHNHLE